MPFPVVPVIMGASALASSIINHFSNKTLANNAYRQNLQMYHMQNQYNSPVSQVARLRAAGLNPAIAYGGNGSVVGNSDSAPQLDYGGVMRQPLVSPDFAMQVNQAMNMQSTRELQRSQKELNDAQIVDELNKGALSGAEASYAKQYALEKLRGMRLSNDKVYQDSLKISQEINNLIVSRNLTKEQIDALRYANEFADRTMEYRIESTQLQPLAMRKSFAEIDAKIKQYSASVALIYENIRSVQINNSMLPSLLQNNLDKGIQEINNLKRTEVKINAEIDRIASETGLDRAKLANFFWLNAPAMSKVPGAMAGAVTDLTESAYHFLPSY